MWYPTFDKSPSPFKWGYDDCVMRKVVFPVVWGTLQVDPKSAASWSKSQNPRAIEKKQEALKVEAIKDDVVQQVAEITGTIESCQLLMEIIDSGTVKETGELFHELVQTIVNAKQRSEDLMNWFYTEP